MGARHVDHNVRADPVMYYKKAEYSGNAIFYGRTPAFDTQDADEKWQIRLVSFEGGETITRFANVGKYNCSWADREDYFSSILPIVGPDFPADVIIDFENNGEPFHIEGSDVTVASTEVELFSFTTPANIVRNLRQLDGSTSVEGIFRIYQGANIIKSSRTAPGNPNIELKWAPSRPIPSGDIIKVTFEAFTATGSAVEAYLSASDIT